MKRNIKIFGCFLVMCLFKGDSCYSQKIIEYEGDTLVALSLDNVKTINSIITEREYLIEELELLSEESQLKDSIIQDQEEIIREGQKILRTELEKCETSAVLAEKEHKKEKRKSIISWASGSLGFGILLGLLL